MPGPQSKYQASRPAGVPVSMLRYTLHYPRYAFSFWGRAFIGVFFGIGGILIGPSKGWAAMLIGAYLFYQLFVERRNIRGRFAYGDLLPGVVVSLEPNWIAVCTDLRKSTRQSHLAVRVLKHRLWKKDVPGLSVGSRVATAASYYGTVDDSWETFEPEPIQYATGNAEDIEFITKQIPEEDWDELFVLLAQVPEPYRPGLYRLSPSVESAV